MPPDRNNSLSQASAEISKIESIETLRRIIPDYSKTLDKRIKNALDAYSKEFIGLAKLAFLASSSPEVAICSIPCTQERLHIIDGNTLALGAMPVPEMKSASESPMAASLYLLVPGIGHALRINGVVRHEGDGCGWFRIEQLYFHCSRAAVRANLWSPAAASRLCAENMIAQSPYLLLKTINAEGKTELSPRGDEPGFVRQMADSTLIIPERPGNKVAVSLRNIIDCAEVELLFLMPGTSNTLRIMGVADIVSGDGLLARCAVNGKIPKVGIRVSIKSSQFATDSHLEEARLWHPDNMMCKTDITSFPKALAAHMNGFGLLGKATEVVVGAVVKHDLKNLY
ncbi:pyridoxamine 5'-phosphate oxidase family protein [Aestuariirhabdus sp. Z084]|uniref:pyridoxamine 5'-phosphate oxidase family protein n=1 Tax=Aestuariirhabdus haliotis TaxID=2918751 RepID=UPI00201B4229|nr:pyridoxamine 5'-phosphate oxidase family protein [Aestuariirhabdus haliotis]MCL6417132.1 pyridoxamine 5'-phosphate oxidase family protein [Aestuariirhabdus haliotis]MCL6421082.1 pyridoxamine 5'-phosphate oxidase family protein [Aestuariirhabdus haliotis]